MNFFPSPSALRGRGFGHTSKKHGGGDNILAAAVEDRALMDPVLDDTRVHVAGPLSSPSTACLALLCEGVLKISQAVLFLVELLL